MQIDLRNQIAVVTGASGQLGRVMARTLASCGADIAIHYRSNRESAENVLRDVRAAGVRGGIFRADVTDRDSVFSMRDEIARELGEPGIIVNNAVVQYQWKPVLEQSAEDYESQFRSCVQHNLFMVQAFVPSMIAKNRGRVIAINTECAMQNLPTQSAYVSGKRGLDGLLRVLAREIGPHQITVNQVAPGWTISDSARGENPPDDKAYASAVPLRRRGTDQEIANAVVFLASGLASYITGAYIPVCGGNVMPSI